MYAGTKRFLSPPDKLKYGMGDIFVKLALINNDKIYHNSKKIYVRKKNKIKIFNFIIIN